MVALAAPGRGVVIQAFSGFEKPLLGSGCFVFQLVVLGFAKSLNAVKSFWLSRGSKA